MLTSTGFAAVRSACWARAAAHAKWFVILLAICLSLSAVVVGIRISINPKGKATAEIQRLLPELQAA
jgi:hypothetical protein